MDKLRVGVTVVVLAVLIFTAYYGLVLYPGAGPDADYGLLYDGVFFFFLVAFLYWYFERLNLDNYSYSLLLSLILLHIGGAFWWYGTNVGRIDFDMIIHAYGGFVLAVFFYRYVTKFADFESDFRLWAIIVLIVLGLSVIHELMEFFGYAFLGKGTGIFMFGAGDFGAYKDVAFDFLSNMIGAIPGAWAAIRYYGK